MPRYLTAGMPVLVIGPSSQTQTTLGFSLCGTRIDQIVPFGPVDLVGSVQVGDEGVCESVSPSWALACSARLSM